MEPPASLMEESAQQPGSEIAQAEEPAFNKTQKLYTDRLPSDEEKMASTEGTPVTNAAAEEKNVAVAEVPAIPKNAKTKKIASPTVASADVAADETIETASLTPAAQPAASAGSVSGWGVQIASAASEDAAWTTFKNMQKHFKILSGKSPVVVKADLGTKGIFYRVRLAGFSDQNGAKSECNMLKSKGVSCFISKSNGTT